MGLGLLFLTVVVPGDLERHPVRHSDAIGTINDQVRRGASADVKASVAKGCYK